MPTAQPRLRRDLIVSRQELPGGVVYVVKDPTVGRFVRFKEPEYFIAQQFDGATSLEEVRRRGEEQFGASLTASTLEQFAGKLRNLGLLDPEPAQQDQAGATSHTHARVRGNIFYLRFKLFDPDRFLEGILPRLRFVFTRQFAWLSIAVILFAGRARVLPRADLQTFWRKSARDRFVPHLPSTGHVL